VEQLRVGDLIVCIGGPARLEYVAEIPGRFEVASIGFSPDFGVGAFPVPRAILTKGEEAAFLVDTLLPSVGDKGSTVFKPVGALTERDLVVAANGEQIEVLRSQRHWVEAVFVLETGDTTILATPSHRAVVPKPGGGGTTTRRVEQLRVGDLIVCIGGPARLEFVAEIPGRFEVVTLLMSTVFPSDLSVGAISVPRSVVTKGKEPVRRGGKNKRADRLGEWDGHDDATADLDMYEGFLG
jgi:hypothetical protein